MRNVTKVLPHHADNKRYVCFNHGKLETADLSRLGWDGSAVRGSGCLFARDPYEKAHVIRVPGAGSQLHQGEPAVA